MVKTEYEEPFIEVIECGVEDIICKSNTDKDETEILPAMYNLL